MKMQSGRAAVATDRNCGSTAHRLFQSLGSWPPLGADGYTREICCIMLASMEGALEDDAVTPTKRATAHSDALLSRTQQKVRAIAAVLPLPVIAASAKGFCEHHRTNCCSKETARLTRGAHTDEGSGALAACERVCAQLAHR